MTAGTACQDDRRRHLAAQSAAHPVGCAQQGQCPSVAPEKPNTGGAPSKWAKHYNVSDSFWQELLSAGALEAYHKQRDNAKARGIAWRFNPATWYEVWRASGKWALRGRGKGLFCMARNGDVGPYSPDNVRIIGFDENSAEIGAVRFHAVLSALSDGPLTIKQWAARADIRDDLLSKRMRAFLRRGRIVKVGSAVCASTKRRCDLWALAEVAA